MQKPYPIASNGAAPTADGPGSDHFRGATSEPQKAGWQEPQPHADDHDTPMLWGTNRLVPPTPREQIPQETVAQRIAAALKAAKDK